MELRAENGALLADLDLPAHATLVAPMKAGELKAFQTIVRPYNGHLVPTIMAIPRDHVRVTLHSSETRQELAETLHDCLITDLSTIDTFIQLSEYTGLRAAGGATANN